METYEYCQSCGMPLGSNRKLYGTNADGKKNPEYCGYCLNDGKFTFEGTLEEMIESKAKIVRAFLGVRTNLFYPDIENSRVNYSASILKTVGTFRFGAIMSVDDIRFAAAVDGYDLSSLDGRTVANIMKERCDTVPGKSCRNATQWIRRW